MSKLDFAETILIKSAELGRKIISKPSLANIAIFSDFVNGKNQLKISASDNLDGKHTRREIIARFLLMNAVLDQGPDVVGVRMLLERVVNKMYENEIKLLHEPLSFYENIDFFLDEINSIHDQIKKERAVDWASLNNSNPNRYNLFFGQSARGIVSIKQSLQFSISRIGIPLSLFTLLENDSKTLIEYLESWESAEIMSDELKDHHRYGLGKVIGNKACHLFAKWYLYSYNLKTKDGKGWDNYSLQLPFDSNIGRVLFRTGWLNTWADIRLFEEHDVIQKNKGKNNTHYIRVTNLRTMNADKNIDNEELRSNYNEIVTNRLKIQTSRWRKMKIPLLINALMLDTSYNIGDIDNGLMYIGTNYCFNHSNPKCSECPMNEICEGYTKNKKLITDFTT